MAIVTISTNFLGADPDQNKNGKNCLLNNIQPIFIIFYNLFTYQKSTICQIMLVKQ
jgi:hypothetical protein